MEAALDSLLPGTQETEPGEQVQCVRAQAHRSPRKGWLLTPLLNSQGGREGGRPRGRMWRLRALELGSCGTCCVQTTPRLSLYLTVVPIFQMKKTEAPRSLVISPEFPRWYASELGFLTLKSSTLSSIPTHLRGACETQNSHQTDPTE